MPSGRRSRPLDERLTFFVDRSLGKHQVAQVFSAADHVVVLMADLYPDGADQTISDEQWIADVSARGWIALTKDTAIVRDHEDALLASTLQVFALTSANLTGAEMAARFERHIHRMVQRARKPGPFVDVVHSDRIERRWP